MRVFRLIPFFALAANAFAQLPPSALRPAKGVRVAPQPAAPTLPEAPVKRPAPVERPAAPRVEAPPQPPPRRYSGNPNTLTPAEIAEGWTLLFDGKRLTGLRGLKRNDPLSAGWKIVGGDLVLPKEIRDMDRITGGDLITTAQYWDFDFRFEWKSAVSSNSGIRYLVSGGFGQTPSGLEYQIIDDVHSPLGLKGGRLRHSGALDNIVPVNSNTLLRTADPLAGISNQWNEGRIVVLGNTVEHWLNGKKACDFQLGPQLRQIAEKNRDNGDKSPRPHALFGMKTKTPIVILDEGTEVAFRNLKIRALVPNAAETPPSPPADPAPAVTPSPSLVQPPDDGTR